MAHNRNTLLQPHDLFNWINNMFPVIPVDLCDAAKRGYPQLRRTTQLLLPATNHQPNSVGCEEAPWPLDPEGFSSALAATATANKRSVGESFLVLLCPSVLVENIVSLIDTFLASNNNLSSLESVCSVHAVDGEAFYRSYGACQGLFERQTAPNAAPMARRQTFYASEIIPGFCFLGDFENGMVAEQLLALGVTHVVDATNMRSSQSTANDLQLQYLAVDVEDHPNAPIESHFDSVIDFIRAAKLTSASSSRASRVLVHCRAGWSRSPTVLMAAMMRLFDFTLKDALTTILKARPNACPNPGFCDKLIQYEGMHMNCDTPSFLTRQDFMLHVAKLNVMWSPPVTEETDFDRIPIRPGGAGGSMGDPAAGFEALLEAESTASVDNPKATVEKKPFLKRGSAAANKRARRDS